MKTVKWVFPGLCRAARVFKIRQQRHPKRMRKHNPLRCYAWYSEIVIRQTTKSGR